jgi:ABC-type oligopeptide transport system substrate-binding subunit
MSKMMKFISPNFIIICLSLLLSGCGITSQLAQTNVELRNAVNSFDRGINALSRESADWQVVLQELQENLVEDTQSTLRVEITNLMRTGLL